MAGRGEMRVIIGFEFSGLVRDAFIAKGHDAMSCDLIDTERPGPHYTGSIFDVIDYPWDLGIFHCPCTHTSVSGAKHFAEKRMDGRQQAAVALFMKTWKLSAHIPKVAFEHPVSIISSLFRKPDQILQPWQFGHPEVKATCLWLRGLPPLMSTEIVTGRTARVHKEPPSPDRWKNRSRTLAGVADAFANQWGQHHQSLTQNTVDSTT